MSVTISDIFNAIPKRFDGEAAGDWNANIQFEFSDGDNWYIAVGEGECSVGTGEVDGASATVKTSADTWIGMTTGTVNPMQAFMSGQLTVGGNMGDVMKLQDTRIFKRA